MNVRQDIRRFILQTFLFTSDESLLGDADSLFQRGIVDSTGVLEVIMHIESQYGIKVLDEEMLPSNLDSVDAITALVERKRGQMACSEVA